jgi:hypothetical protein
MRRKNFKQKTLGKAAKTKILKIRIVPYFYGADTDPYFYLMRIRIHNTELFHVVFLAAGEYQSRGVCVLQAALDHLLHCLTRFHTIFQRHGLDPEIIGQANIFSKRGIFWIFLDLF